jgi:dienelactone hydrolase
MSQIETLVVSVPRANAKGVMDSFFVKPEGSGPFPGMIVIHEIFGLNDNIRQISREFARQDMRFLPWIYFQTATARFA